jgi:hypothetical protein
MFDVRGAESFQSEYQRLVESLLRKITDLEEKSEREAQRQNKGQSTSIEPLGKGNITISDNKGNVLYDKELGKCNISPEQMQKLEEASIANPGEVVEKLPSLKVEVDGETFFESQDNKVVVNRRATLDLETEQPLALPGEVKVFLSQQGESELIYGQVGKKLIDKLTSDQVEQLSQGSDLTAGTRVEAMAGLKVKAGDEVLFQADESGTILVNERTKLQSAIAQIQFSEQSVVTKHPVSHQAQVEESDYYDDYPDDEFSEDYDYPAEQSNPDAYAKELSEIEADEQQNEDVLADVLVEMMVPIIEAMPAIEQEPFQETQEEDIFFEEPLAQSQDKQSQEVETAEISLEVATPQPTSVLLPQKTGLDAVQEALGDMKPGTLKSVLQGMAVDMQETLLSQPPTPALSHVVETRVQDRQNPHWWDTLSTKISTAVTAVQETFTQHQAASTLKDFANRMALQPGDSFESKDYNLSRQGKDYTLKDQLGNELLKFQSSPLGVKVDKTLPALSATHFSKTQQLRQDFKTGQQHKGAFVSQGAAEATNIERINTITQALTQYAAAQGGRAKVQGKFNYSFEASSNGSAIIRNKEGKALLAVGLGEMRTRMTEKDLSHFEQMLPALQGSAQQSSAQHEKALLPLTAVSGKQMER